MHPSTSPVSANFTLMTECTPESSGRSPSLQRVLNDLQMTRLLSETQLAATTARRSGPLKN